MEIGVLLLLSESDAGGVMVAVLSYVLASVVSISNNNDEGLSSFDFILSAHDMH